MGVSASFETNVPPLIMILPEFCAYKCPLLAVSLRLNVPPFTISSPLFVAQPAYPALVVTVPTPLIESLAPS
jgi:hypothetical protein